MAGRGCAPATHVEGVAERQGFRGGRLLPLDPTRDHLLLVWREVEATAEGVARRRAAEAAAIAGAGRCLSSKAPQMELRGMHVATMDAPSGMCPYMDLHQHCLARLAASRAVGQAPVPRVCFSASSVFLTICEVSHTVGASTGSVRAAFKAGATGETPQSMPKTAQSKGAYCWIYN